MLINRNFYHSSGVECDYDTERHCEEYGCGDYCRCSRIKNEKVVYVDVSAITKIIYDYYFDDSVSTVRNYKINNILFGTSKEVDIYTIDRVLRKNEIWKNKNWLIGVAQGYYGEEIQNVILETSFAEILENEIRKALSIEFFDKRIEYLLTLEYGSVLNKLENCSYEVIEIDKSDILFGSKLHSSEVSKKTLNHYSDRNYKGIRGIVLEEQGEHPLTLRLIDGYHRIHSTSGYKVKVIKAKRV
jgi:hypothetical protein